LDRLTSVLGPAGMTMGYTPDKNGNILTKSDAGTFSYDDYAVTSISNHQNISTTPQTINYYSFEKVKDITEGTKKAEFVYNADQQRIRMILKTNGATTKTRWCFGSSCERELAGGVTTQYIWIGGNAYTAVAVAKKVGTGSWTVYNIFRDHLGTITHLKTGGTISEYNFDACSVKFAFRDPAAAGEMKSLVELIPRSEAVREGRRRDKDTCTYTLTSEPALFADRGFTHEYLDDFKLYNMNGRMYSLFRFFGNPVVGRFLSPDPFIQAPDFTQSFNRYSYCLNNPLKYSDPSGFVERCHRC
jgi:RHS repeat-associated protein